MSYLELALTLGLSSKSQSFWEMNKLSNFSITKKLKIIDAFDIYFQSIVIIENTLSTSKIYK